MDRIFSKKRMAVFMAFALVVQMLPLPAGVLGFTGISRAAGPTSGNAGANITWTLTAEAAKPGWSQGSNTAYRLELSGTGQMDAYSTETYKVGSNTYIRTNAPWKEDIGQIQTIVIGSGITNVSKYAFYDCENALDLQIAGSVTSIGASAFERCSSLLELNIPSGVKNIGDDAFYSCASATTLNIPNGVTSIGTNAFAFCSSVTGIKIPNSITSISDFAFNGCGSATTLDLPGTITGIGYAAFKNCSALKAINIPAGVKTVGTSAFSYCTDAVSVNIPATVTALGSEAFSYCSNLKEVTVPGSVGTIGSSTFSNCRVLEKATICDGITSIGNSAFANCAALSETGITFPKSSLVSLGQDCFSNTGMLNFEVPASVTKITSNPCVGGKLKTISVAAGNKNYEAQNNMLIELKNSKAYQVMCYPCEGGKDARIPAPVEVIGSNAFKQAKLETVDMPGSLMSIEDSAFYAAKSLRGIDIPGKVTSIKGSAFRDCISLKDVKLGGDLLSIGGNAFYGCKEIVALSLPDKITSIGDSAFNSCSKLKELAFPNSITSIGGSVLANCAVLEKVSFGEKIQTISGNVFNACPKLAEITISPNNTYMTVENSVVYNKDKTRLIYYAAGLPDEKYVMADTVETVGGYAFTYCTSLAELRFPEKVAVIEDYAIYHNDMLGKLLFYGNAPKVNEYEANHKYKNGKLISCDMYNSAVRQNKVKNSSYDNSGMVVFKTQNSTGWENGWENSKKASTVYVWKEKFNVQIWDPAKTDKAEGDFGNGLKWKYRDDIGELVFFGSGKIPDVTPGNLYTWSNDTKVDHMQDIKLIETGPATEVGNYAFYGAKNLVRILSDDKLARIGEASFAECTALKIVQVSGASKIEKEAFRGDTAIVDELDVRGAKDIGEGVFKDCTGMTDILLGEGLTKLGKEAFRGCVVLETLILPETLTSLGEGCFRGCQALRTINIPKKVTSVPESCFAECPEFRKIYFYGNPPAPWGNTSLDGTHGDMTIYYRKSNTSWNTIGNQWNGIPVVGLDKFYTEKKDHYSFANAGSSFGYGGRYYIPRQRYVTAMQSIIRGSYYYAWDKGWKGSCFGMASSSTEFYQGTQFDVKDYSAEAKTLYNVAAPKDSNADLTKLIEIYQVSQYVDEIGEAVADNYGKYRRLIRQVEEFERSGGLGVDSTADPVVMCIYTKCTGHAVVPVAVNMDTKGNYILDVYDCNSPSGLQKLTIKKDFSEIVYGQYKTASFVKYSTIRDALKEADFTGNNMKKSAVESNKVSVAVNREQVKLVNGGGKDYKEIKGAYEQRLMSADTGESFGGIRSFVLPQGEYKIKDDNSTQKDALQYYVSTEDLFSEVETSDKDAELTVKSVKGTGYDSVTLASAKSDTVSDVTVMDVSGIKKEISVKGGTLSVEVENDETMKLSVDNASSVKVDGKDVMLQDGKADVSFYASKGENPMKAEELNCRLTLDKEGKLSGMAEAYVTWADKKAQDVSLVLKVKDEKGNVIAEHQEKVNLKAGMQKVNVSLDKKEANLGNMSGEIKAVCEMTLEDGDNNKANVSVSGISLKKAGTVVIPTSVPAPPSVSQEPSTPTPTPTATPAATQEPPAVTQEPPAETERPAVTQEPSDIQTPTPVPDGSGDEEPPAAPKKKVKTVGSLKYVVLNSSKKNGTAAVCGAKKKSAKSVTIPKKVKIGKRSYKVVGIDKNAFKNMRKLSKVTIGSNVKTIGDGAFKNCKKLEFIILPGKVTKIGKQSFAGCTKLRYLVLKTNRIKAVGAKAFQGVSPSMKVKTTKSKWAKYQKMFVNKGKMPKKALFLIYPVMIKYNGKSY